MGGMYDPAHPGEIIREAIVAEGWTVGDAAARLGVTRNTLSRVLNGKAGVSPSRFLERLGCDAATGCVCLTSWRKPGKRIRGLRQEAGTAELTSR